MALAEDRSFEICGSTSVPRPLSRTGHSSIRIVNQPLMLPGWSFEELRVKELSVGGSVSLAAIALPSRPQCRRMKEQFVCELYRSGLTKNKAIQPGYR